MRFPRLKAGGKGKTLGLVAAGKFVDSPLSRLLMTGTRLGPVKAPTLRVASRIANTLRAGHPVRDYEPFEHCGLILIGVPDRQVRSTLAELCSFPLTWTGKAVVLYSPTLGSEELEAFASAGAEVGSLAVIPGFEERWLLLDVEKPVYRRIAKIIDLSSRRLTIIPPRTKPLFLAGLACSGPMVGPLLIAARNALEKAGVPIIQASAILERQVQVSLRAYMKAGRKTQQPVDLSHLNDRLRSQDKNLALYLSKSLEAAKLVGK